MREQKLQEAQLISEAVLDAEVRIGELMREVPKASHDRGNQYTGGKPTAVSDSQKPKAEVIREAGFTPKQAERFQQLAAHPEIVEQAKAEARENIPIPEQHRSPVLHPYGLARDLCLAAFPATNLNNILTNSVCQTVSSRKAKAFHTKKKIALSLCPFRT